MTEAPRPRGRPRAFDPDAALDRAVAVFSRRGYAGAGVAELTAAMGSIMEGDVYRAELASLLTDYVGRPTPLTVAKRLARALDPEGQVIEKILLKREDLCHTGAHKINNALGQVLLAVPTELAAARALRREAADADRTRDAYERDDGLQRRTGAAYAALAERNWQGRWTVAGPEVVPRELAQALTS